ncbi:MAG: hypothetical protein J1F39_04285, partial [Clostridiales bacterium]|nr:hypothetical protein [Clostridiales bacterium]
GVLIMSVVSVVYRFVLYGLVALVQWISDAAHFVPIATQIVITVVAVGIFILHVLTIVPILYWAPMMFVYGYGLRDAAAYSFKMIGGKKVGRGIMLPLVICAGIQLLVGFTGAHNVVVTIVDFVVYLFTNMYVTVYVIVSFYHVSELDRRDVVVYMPIVTEPVKPEPKPDKPKDREDKDEPKEGDESAREADGQNNDKKAVKTPKTQAKGKANKANKATGKKPAANPSNGGKKNKSKSETASSGGEVARENNAEAEEREGGDVV